ncbi:MAG: LysM peptidoglycan-binding domain-containing protein [Sporichthyaceae bacterium]|nr:LysM peptidoglycan-binding domain-containing protein [Sporichthyaceae bacterium]
MAARTAARSPVPAHADSIGSAADLPRYVVRPGDNLWDIAERYLGDGLRYHEIWSLNHDLAQTDGRPMADPDLIHPGWVLRMPADARNLPDYRPPTAATPAMTYTVQPGDTLSGIAHRVLGDAAMTAALFDLNRGRPQPDGRTLTDPDLIHPGWLLRLPAGDPAGASSPPTAHVPPPVTAPIPTQAPPPDSEAPGAARPSPTPAPTAADQPPAVDDDQLDPSAVAASAAGALLAGALLAACLLRVLAKARRHQLRLRAAPTGITLPPPESLRAERDLRTVEHPAGIELLDLGLRGLCAVAERDPAFRLPELVAARLGADQLDLIVEPGSGPPPPPYRAGTPIGTLPVWSLPAAAVDSLNTRQTTDMIAPYPALATIGATDDAAWLLDLEHAGSIALTGDHRRASDLIRYLAAELAHNRWSDDLNVSLVGVGKEFAELRPDRLQYLPHSASLAPRVDRWLGQTINALATSGAGGVLTGRALEIDADGWIPEIILVGGPLTPDETQHLNQLCARLAESDRAALAVVVVGEMPAATWQLTIGPDGGVDLPVLGVRVTAQALPADLAPALVDLMRSPDRDINGDGDGASHPQQDLAIVQAPATEPGPPPELEVLTGYGHPYPGDEPSDTEAPDLAEPARARPRLVVPTDEGRQQRVTRERDPDLDDDLAAWSDPTTAHPRVAILGPVTVTATGEEPTSRLAWYREVAAFLATRPDRRATVEELAETLWGGKPVLPLTRRESLSRVRRWLGEDDTGQPYLPTALPVTGTHYVLDPRGSCSTGTCSSGFAPEPTPSVSRASPICAARSAWSAAGRSPMPDPAGTCG